MNEALIEAREILAHVTPLKSDCGRTCGARCCASLEGDETGMLLFPGEEDFYEDLDGWTIRPAGKDLLLICPGACDRDDRPLACRMFPLLPVLRDGQLKILTDERSRAVCPLARSGKKGMDPAFVSAVQAAGELLTRNEEQKEFLLRLSTEQEDLKALRRLLLP